MGLMMICYGMAVKRVGMLGVSGRKMKALTVGGTSYIPIDTFFLGRCV
jgi:hypothetical protein